MTAEIWDAMYTDGFDADTPPSDFVVGKLVPALNVLLAASGDQEAAALDIGTGTGKNLPPLLDTGLARIDAVDMSSKALERARVRLQERGEERKVRLWHGDFKKDFGSQVPPAAQYAAVLAIFAFHTGREETHQGLALAGEYVMPGGLLAVCASAALRKGPPTDLEPQVWPDGGYTVGAANGLRVHSFSEKELHGSLGAGMRPLNVKYTEMELANGRTVASWSTIWQRT